MDILVQEGKEHKESEEFVPLENIGMMQNLKQNYDSRQMQIVYQSFNRSLWQQSEQF